MPSVTLNGQLVTVQPGGDSAEDHRKQTAEFSHAPGPVDWTSMRITLVSGLTLNIGQGAAHIRSPNDFTLYRASQDGVDARLTVTTANATNPRIDQVGIRIYDDAVDGSGQYQANVETIDGTPTSGATLDNRTGAPDPRTALTGANAWLPLADILVPANSASVTAIRDRRPIGQYGMVPPLNLGGSSNVDQVTMIPAAGQMISRQQILGSDVNSKQAAALCYLPRAIAATKLRWAYYIDVLGAGSKNFKIAIMDASGRYIADTGNVAWVGTATNTTRISPNLTLPYSGYIFDVGYYYVMMLHGNGIANTDSLYGVSIYAGNPGGSTINTVVSAPNIFLGSQTGALTIPAALNIAGTTFVDLGVNQTSLPQTPVPVITLSK